MERRMNPVVYFEIPVCNMERAMAFYQSIFGFVFEREKLDGYDMAFFPLHDNQLGITGALAKGDVYQPSKKGPVLYFYIDDIDKTLEKAARLGVAVLYPKTVNIDYRFAIAEIEDSEGNRIALKQIL